MEGESIVYARRAAYAYRRHPENATELQSRSLLRFEEEFRLFDEIAERADAIGWRRAARVSRRKTILRLHLGYRALAELAALRPGQAASYLGYLARKR